MNDLLKKLAGKDRHDYEFAASSLLDSGDEILFKELVDNDSFLFDFVKQNIANRLLSAVNKNNYKNLLKFLKYYSPFYCDFISEAFVKFGDEDLNNELFKIFQIGSDDEKCYCAKYFSLINLSDAIPIMRANVYTGNENLNMVCAQALGELGDEQSFNFALEELQSSQDDFESLKRVKFLISYGDKRAVMPIIENMILSSFQETIAGEIPYLIGIFELLNMFEIGGLLVLNNIINGLGETIPLSCVIDFEIKDVLYSLISHPITSVNAVILLNALEKFETLTENNEYLYDEDKNTKDEIEDIKRLLCKQNRNNWLKYVNDEIRENSFFVYTALNYCTDVVTVKNLLRSDNQTLILRALEVLKNLDALDNSVKTIALSKVQDIHIKDIIRAL